MHVGPVTIMPGASREVDESYMEPRDLDPECMPEADETKDPGIVIADMLDGTIPEIGSALPSLDNETLDALENTEKKGQDRTGVSAAIAAERLSRADSAKQAEEYAELVAPMETEELQTELGTVTDEGLKGIIEAEIEKRNANG